MKTNRLLSIAMLVMVLSNFANTFRSDKMISLFSMTQSDLYMEQKDYQEDVRIDLTDGAGDEATPRPSSDVTSVWL